MIAFRDYEKQIKKHRVLHIPAFVLEARQIHGFWGRNGSGKTMLFRAICGLIQPSAGTVTVFGETLGNEISFPRDLGLLIEQTGFWPQLSGVENLRLLAGIKGKIGDDGIYAAAERIGLSKADAERKYGAYSLGMKQKLAIAQAIMEKPALLILDEPSNSLDDAAVEALWRIIREEKDRGATVLVSSHHQSELSLCDRVYRIDGGCIQEG